ncbi:hypothetical protein P691DRAFT_803272 [Macrolepiota fuliginosa MF-IS2]|uniref:Uncharacterized protein n=1 Tax=Macrolepiota fuliginosa MF-IS2 TaxID=1400762 RepID=A0A9P5X927_9AGAR|nr:hypothetical protein P691DRAFT_803272 [Macrolepiota fuliginosa MF-IS2]
MESKNPQLKKVLQNGAKLVEQQRKETSVDWSTVDFSALAVQENVTWWLRSTTLTDGGTETEPARFMLECMTYGNKIDASRMVDKYKNTPTSEEVLHFIRRCIAKPLPGLEPCLPSILIIQRNLKPHTLIIKAFLDKLPVGFNWAIESEAASTSSISLFSYDIPLSMAKEYKSKGNQLYSQRNRKGAIYEYTNAIDRLMNALRSDPNRDKNKDAERLLAVCCANRAAAYLMPGDDVDVDSDLHEAWKDGEIAIRADPSYAKGYIRVSTAHQRLRNIKKAKETLVRGLRRTDLQNEPGLVDKLIQLQTDGKGFPENEEELLAWQELVLVEDEESVKMMEGVHGLWRKRLSDQLALLRTAM